ncbi:MAG: YbaB/EbfC family nucleoid-associated protein [Anaerolineales bacterium]|nr:MAG: YbaB/EbfC family nucleoid-associated protein [Anaerolineales bacterium]
MAKRPKSPGSGLGGQGVMQQIQQLQEQMIKAQEALAEEQVTGSAGGGAVTVVVTGNQRVLSVEVDAGLIEDGDQEILQDLILTAINQGLDKSRKLAEEKMGPLAGQGLPF